MNKADAVQWLGNRGHMFEVSDIIKCKKITMFPFSPKTNHFLCKRINNP